MTSHSLPVSSHLTKLQRRASSACYQFLLLQVYELILCNTIHVRQLSLRFGFQPRRFPGPSYPQSCVHSEANVVKQFLFIDLFLILPIAIFSMSSLTLSSYTTTKESFSGLDGTISDPMSQEANRESCFPQGSYTITGPNCPVHYYSKPGIWIRTAAGLVIRRDQTQIRSCINCCHRFIPPVLDKERSNIENSENTALFLISCFQYILSAIVLSVGPPFRQTMANNRKSALLLDQWQSLTGG